VTNRPLAPREEITLRRIALGYAQPSDLPQTHVGRLKRLGLIVENDGTIALTPQGKSHYDALARPLGPASNETPDELLRLLNMLVARPRL
jgi:hypothetical protein